MKTATIAMFLFVATLALVQGNDSMDNVVNAAATMAAPGDLAEGDKLVLQKDAGNSFGEKRSAAAAFCGGYTWGECLDLCGFWGWRCYWCESTHCSCHNNC